MLEIFALGGARLAYRYFRYSRTLNQARNLHAAPTILVGRAADAEVFLRGVESGAVKRMWPVGVLSPSRSDRGQLIRGISVLGGLMISRTSWRISNGASSPIQRLVMMPSAFEAEASPESVLTRARKLGLTVSRMPSLEGSGETASRARGG